MWSFVYKLASPKSFFRIADRAVPWLSLLCLGLFAYGLFAGLFIAPPDYQQGDAFRIIYVHVPCAAMSLGVYMVIATSSLIFLVWKIKLADVIAKVSVPIGAMFTALALITGSIWGKPMWGTWWIWDARLTSELILLFIYFAIMALRSALPDATQAAKACGIFALVAAVDIPIIHYSVNWWQTLHQKATILALQKPSIAPEMLYPLLAMLAAFAVYYVLVMFVRAQNELLQREKQTAWVKQVSAPWQPDDALLPGVLDLTSENE